MPQFDVNIQALFNEVPFLERFQQVAATGLGAVEMSVPYAFTPAQIRQQLDRFQLQAVLINSPGGDPTTQRGLACQPALRDEFRASLDTAIEMANAIGCKLIHCPSGYRREGSADEIAATYCENIALAADLFAKAGIKLGIEPINSHDLPGYYLTGSEQAMEVIRTLGHPNVGLILDVYHLARMGEDIPSVIRSTAEHIFHVQIGDVPGKGEPGTGSINFDEIFVLLDEVDYEGWIGLEYRPRSTTVEGLSWLGRYQ